MSLEKGKLLDKAWNDNSNLNAWINDCINIENNIIKINELNKIINSINLNKNIKIIFNKEEEQITEFLNTINSFGEIIIKEKNEINYDFYNNFDIQFKKPILTLSNHTNMIYCLALMKDGRLVSGSADESIIIYNKESYKPDLIIKEYKHSVLCLIQLSTGILASCFNDRTIILFNINGVNYKIVQKLNYHTGPVYKIIELKNKMLVSCSDDSSIVFYKKDNLEYKKDYSISTDG